METPRFTDAEEREVVRILRCLVRIRGRTLPLTNKERNALRRARLILKRYDKRHDKNRADTP